ncbi:hypothetical protein [Alteromonas sp. 14N.309.X.WAT.G.H12]|uniref:hypothetical protein n=1 Tax=Alteromonas sp. 14N.309.X.WAT.G.H12 TaxID=3120824 RepID=UPI002FD60136
MTTLNTKPFFALLLLLCAHTGQARAAFISWYPTFDTESVEDVVTLGESVEAYNFSFDSSNVEGEEDQSTVIADAIFVESSTYFSDDTGGKYDFLNGETTGSSEYDAILSTLDFGGGEDVVQLQIGDNTLTVGNTYLVQIWFTDLRDGINGGDRIMSVGDGSGNDVLLSGEGEGLGEYVIGVFVADDISQLLEFQVFANAGNVHINALQVRDVTGESLVDLVDSRNLAAVPAPWTGISLVIFFLLSRRRLNVSLYFKHHGSKDNGTPIA